MAAYERATLGAWDYVTFIAVIILASCIGIYHAVMARRTKNTADFLIRSHDLGLAPLILSTAATFLSAIGILGVPTETYNNGVIFFGNAISFILIIPLGALLFLPIYFNLGINTIYEYLELRFNRVIRMCASVILTLQLVLYTSCVIYAPALALNQVTGLDLWASVASIGTICILYTSMGGIKAVVWADVTQMLVMIIVILIVNIRGALDLGGMSRIWEICAQGKRTNFFIFSQNEHSSYTLWTLLIAATTHYLGVLINNQLFLQRYICNRNLKSAQWSFAGGCLTISIFTVLNIISGLIIYARYHDCDPLINGQVTSYDQMMALFSVETLSFCQGLPGIFVAAILCATLSTLSSSLNSLSTVTIEDYIKPLRPNLKETQAMRLAKVIAMLYGVVCIAFVLLAEQIGGLIKATFTIYGMTGGPVMAVFTMGMLCPWINSKGAVTGFFTSIVLISSASIGSLVSNPVLPSAPVDTSGCNITSYSNAFNSSLDFGLANDGNFTDVHSAPVEMYAPYNGFTLYTYSSLWYTSWSCLICFVVATTTSMLTGVQNFEDLDPRLIFPFVVRLIRRLPQKYQEILGFKSEKSVYLHVTTTDPDNLVLDTAETDEKPPKYSEAADEQQEEETKMDEGNSKMISNGEENLKMLSNGVENTSQS